MVILIKVLQFILALSLLIFVHELGHFAAAKIFKTRVEKFYLFFDWGFSLVRCKRVNGKLRWRFFAKNVPDKYEVVEKTNADGKKEKEYIPIDLSTLPEDDWRRSDETEYGIGWFPLGGYNKIAGMIDESMDKEQMKQPPQAWEFRSKPAWQRFIIMFGGVFMNVVLAIFVYIGILASNGEQYLPTSEVNDKGGIYADSLAQAFGLQDGDKILNVNGKEVADFYRIMETVVFEKAEYIEVERQGQRVKVELPDEAISMLLAQTENRFINVRVPFIVDSILVNSPAYASGFKKGDQILGIDSITTLYFQDYVREKNAFKDQDVTIVVKRNDEILNIPTHLNEEGNLGVFSALPSNYFEFKTVDYSLLEAIPAGTKKTFTEISDYWKQLKLIFQPETKAYESVGGFISIGKIFPESFQWLVFWRLTAFLSIALAVMNILPIPALDGGHILFLIVEMITRRKPSDKFMEIAETIGLFLVLALLIFANGNDIIKLFR